MSAAVHRSERHGSINWGRKGEEEVTSRHQRQTEAGTHIRNYGQVMCLYTQLRNKTVQHFEEVLTFSTRSIKKSLTSLVFVNFAAMLTRLLERFYKKRWNKGLNKSYWRIPLQILWVVLTLKLASISLKALVFPLRAVQTKLNTEVWTQIVTILLAIQYHLRYAKNTTWVSVTSCVGPADLCQWLKSLVLSALVKTLYQDRHPCLPPSYLQWQLNLSNQFKVWYFALLLPEYTFLTTLTVWILLLRLNQMHPHPS